MVLFSCLCFPVGPPDGGTSVLCPAPLLLIV
uniref:Uncharacterized protein n=1 Tax=Anguilla anguilla TaxID=7936 RepID=A0A0E9WBU3_ANGAN